jgi:HD-like signal output (HDOD) protein
VISEVLGAVDNTNISASRLGNLIERDQALTAKVLRVANSPFYGFSRKISTIDLAIVVMGLNTIKEIVLSLAIQKFFTNINPLIFNVKSFWQYSVFCGSCARLLARKLGYRLVGEAFVAGLMHDIGILIIIQYFYDHFKKIRELIRLQDVSLIRAEKLVLKCTHCDIGAWIAEKWNLPSQLCRAIRYHHSTFSEVQSALEFEDSLKINTKQGIEISFSETEQPLTAIVAMTEWFADEMKFNNWTYEARQSNLYMAGEVLEEISSHDLLNPESAINALKQEIIVEYQKASVFNEILLKGRM